MGAVAAIGIITAATGALAGDTRSQSEKYQDATSELQDISSGLEKVISLRKQLNNVASDMANGVGDNNENLAQFKKCLEDVAEISPTAATAVQLFNGGVISQSEALQIANNELDTYIAKQKELQRLQALQALSTYTTSMTYASMGDALGPHGVGDVNYRVMDNSLPDVTRAQWIRNLVKNKSWQEMGVSNMIDFGTPEEKALGTRHLETIQAYVEAMSLFLDLTDEQLLRKSDEFIAMWDNKIADDVRAEAQNVVGIMMQTVTDDLDDVQMSVLQMALEKALVGDSYEEKDLMESNIKRVFNMLPEIIQDVMRDTNDESSSFILDAIESKFGLTIGGADWQFLIPINLDEFGNAEYAVEELDYAVLKTIYDMLSMGATVEQIEEAFANSVSLEDFKRNLAEIKIEASGTSESVDETTKTLSDYVKEIASITTEIDSVQKLLDNIKAGKTVTFSDLWGLKDTHPELMGLVGDIDSLQEALLGIQAANQDLLRENVAQALLNDNAFFQSVYEGDFDVANYKELIELNPDEESSILEWVYNLVDAMLAGVDAAEE